MHADRRKSVRKNNFIFSAPPNRESRGSGKPEFFVERDSTLARPSSPRKSHDFRYEPSARIAAAVSNSGPRPTPVGSPGRFALTLERRTCLECRHAVRLSQVGRGVPAEPLRESPRPCRIRAFAPRQQIPEILSIRVQSMPVFRIVQGRDANFTERAWNVDPPSDDRGRARRPCRAAGRIAAAGSGSGPLPATVGSPGRFALPGGPRTCLGMWPRRSIPTGDTSSFGLAECAGCCHGLPP